MKENNFILQLEVGWYNRNDRFLLAFVVLPLRSRIKKLLQQHSLGDSSPDKGCLAKDEVGDGDGGEEGSGDGGLAGESVGSYGGGGERDWATSDGRGDTGGEEERLRRGGGQAESQSQSVQALNNCIFTKCELLLKTQICLRKEKRSIDEDTYHNLHG